MYIYLVPSPIPDALAAYPHLTLRSEEHVRLAIESAERLMNIESDDKIAAYEALMPQAPGLVVVTLFSTISLSQRMVVTISKNGLRTVPAR